ncbi:MAG: hypothetical protein Q8P50_04980 [Bacillota bacterium]|nr:hypothetical protein [Bacillota bacterium]
MDRAQLGTPPPGVPAGQPLEPFVAEMAASDWLVMEIAAGPGGGHMPRVVLANPHARLLVNDLSHTVLEGWSNALKQYGVGERATFAAFDARRMPLAAAR